MAVMPIAVLIVGLIVVFTRKSLACGAVVAGIVVVCAGLLAVTGVQSGSEEQGGDGPKVWFGNRWTARRSPVRCTWL